MVQPDLFEQLPRVYTVTQINERVRALLDEALGDVYVEGELSNTRRHTSGHWYFTLKDAQSQLDAVLFRSDAQSLRFTPENGLRVRAYGRLTLYAPQGRYQLQVQSLLPVGYGELELAFRQLQEKLQREGLFDSGRKRPLPRLPRRVALVTSPTGAAVRDLIATLAARWPLVHIRVVPVAVQGAAAAAEIVQALEFVNRVRAADVIVVGRGGGSLEDLWAFNSEGVARAIAASRIPVVSAVGHEVDFTIADFVADQRAATPTAAATLVVPHRDEVAAFLRAAGQRAARALRRRCDLEQHRLEKVRKSYAFQRPRLLLQELEQTLDGRCLRLQRGVQALLERRTATLAGCRGRLQALSPRGVLGRGFTYCVDARSGRVLTRAEQTRAEQRVRIHFADGPVPARIEAAAAPDAGDLPERGA